MELNGSFHLFSVQVWESLFLQALESGKLTRGGVVTEGSAGSTAISLATVAPAYGCRCHVAIPDDAAIEKVCRSSTNYPFGCITSTGFSICVGLLSTFLLPFLSGLMEDGLMF